METYSNAVFSTTQHHQKLQRIIKQVTSSTHSTATNKILHQKLPRKRLFSLGFKSGYDPFFLIVLCFVLRVERNPEQQPEQELDNCSTRPPKYTER